MTRTGILLSLGYSLSAFAAGGTHQNSRVPIGIQPTESLATIQEAPNEAQKKCIALFDEKHSNWIPELKLTICKENRSECVAALLSLKQLWDEKDFKTACAAEATVECVTRIASHFPEMAPLMINQLCTNKPDDCKGPVLMLNSDQLENDDWTRAQINSERESLCRSSVQVLSNPST